MGARIFNNQRTKNRGSVGGTPSLDIRQLRRSGAIVDGEQTVRQLSFADWPAAVLLIADLRPGRQPAVALNVPGKRGDNRHLIRLTSRPTQYGGRRWYFSDETSGPCEKLYLVGGRFVSRKSGRLTYRSQSAGYLERIVDRRDKLQARLEGDATRGHARGKIRQKLMRELKQIEEAIDAYGDTLGPSEVRQAGRRRRRAASNERLEAAARMMRHRQDVTPAEIIERFTPLIEELKQGEKRLRTRSSVAERAPASALELEESPHVDIGTIARLGYVKEGELLADQLGWPEEWLPERERRLFFLVDARQRRRVCTVLILEDRERVDHQFFWMTRVKGLFGRQEYRFVCPPKGVLSRELLYVDGRFTCPNPPKAKKKSPKLRGQPAAEQDEGASVSHAEFLDGFMKYFQRRLELKGY